MSYQPDLQVITWGADAIGANADRLPAGIPALWPYKTGSSSIVWDHEEVLRIAPRHVWWVNQEFGSHGPLDGDEFDVEAGAWTVAECVDIARARRAVHWSTKFYVTWASYGLIKGELAEAGITSSINYRIADWNLDDHLASAALHFDVYAGQFASPTSNPLTLFPDTQLTLQELGADLNVLLPAPMGWQG